MDPPLPYLVEGEHQATWYMDAQDVDSYVRGTLEIWPEKAGNLTVRGRVTLGSQKAIVSKNSFPLG